MLFFNIKCSKIKTSIEGNIDYTLQALIKNRTLFFILTSLFVSGCGLFDEPEGEVSRAISEEIASGSTEFDLKKITAFEWEKFVVYGGYNVSQEIICRDLEVDVNDCDFDTPRIYDGDSDFVLAFSNQGQVIHAERHLYKNGIFSLHLELVTPLNSIFSIRKMIKVSYLVPKESVGPIDEKLIELISDRNNDEVNLNTITEFEWDSVYIFTEPQSRTTLCDLIMLNIDECNNAMPFQINRDDKYWTHLIFLNNEELVHAEIRYTGGLEFKEYVNPVQFDNSIFDIEKTINSFGDDTYRLYQKNTQ